MTCIRCKYDWCCLCGDIYQKSHIYSCEAQKAMKNNVSCFTLSRTLSSRIILVFYPIVYAVDKVYYNTGIGYKLRSVLEKMWLSYLVAVLLGIISLPLFYTIGPITLSIWIAKKFERKYIGFDRYEYDLYGRRVYKNRYKFLK